MLTDDFVKELRADLWGPAWLVYADWLMEKGDPRGTFIKLDFDARATGYNPDGMDGVPSELTQKWLAIQKQQAALWREHMHTWSAPFHKGEISQVHGYVAHVGTQWRTYDHSPLDWAKKWNDLVSSENGAFVTSLNLFGESDAGPDNEVCLAAHAFVYHRVDFRKLRSLSFGGVPAGPDLMAACIQLKMPELEELNLVNTDMTPEALRLLVQSKPGWLRTLKKIHFSYDEVDSSLNGFKDWSAWLIAQQAYLMELDRLGAW